MNIKDDDVITKWEWINMTAAFQQKEIKIKDFVDLIDGSLTINNGMHNNNNN